MKQCKKHTWEIDPTRKHKRPPRVFVRCVECGATGQGTMKHGFLDVFRVDGGMVQLTVKVTREQYEQAVASGNKSRYVRQALDKAKRNGYTIPHKQ